MHLHGGARQRTSFNRRGAFRTEEHSLQAIVLVVYSGPKCYWSCRNETTIIISHIPTFHPVLHTGFTTAAPRQLPNSSWPSRIKEYNQIILFRFCPNIYIEAGQESRMGSSSHPPACMSDLGDDDVPIISLLRVTHIIIVQHDDVDQFTQIVCLALFLATITPSSIPLHPIHPLTKQTTRPSCNQNRTIISADDDDDDDDVSGAEWS